MFDRHISSAIGAASVYGGLMTVKGPVEGFAVAVVREDGRWRCERLDDAVLSELDTAITELRRLRSTGAVFGLLAVDDEFFVIVRPAPGGVALFLSDASARSSSSTSAAMS